MHGEVEDLAMLFRAVCGLPEGDGASGLVRGGQVHLRLHSRACSWWCGVVIKGGEVGR